MMMMILMMKSEMKPKIFCHEAWKQTLLSVPAHIHNNDDDDDDDDDECHFYDYWLFLWLSWLLLAICA